MTGIAPEDLAALRDRVDAGEPVVVVAREYAHDHGLPVGAVLHEIRGDGGS